MGLLVSACILPFKKLWPALFAFVNTYKSTTLSIREAIHTKYKRATKRFESNRKRALTAFKNTVVAARLSVLVPPPAAAQVEVSEAEAGNTTAVTASVRDVQPFGVDTNTVTEFVHSRSRSLSPTRESRRRELPPVNVRGRWLHQQQQQHRASLPGAVEFEVSTRALRVNRASEPPAARPSVHSLYPTEAAPSPTVAVPGAVPSGSSDSDGSDSGSSIGERVLTAIQNDGPAPAAAPGPSDKVLPAAGEGGTRPGPSHLKYFTSAQLMARVDVDARLTDDLEYNPVVWSALSVASLLQAFSGFQVLAQGAYMAVTGVNRSETDAVLGGLGAAMLLFGVLGFHTVQRQRLMLSGLLVALSLLSEAAGAFLLLFLHLPDGMLCVQVVGSVQGGGLLLALSTLGWILFARRHALHARGQSRLAIERLRVEMDRRMRSPSQGARVMVASRQLARAMRNYRKKVMRARVEELDAWNALAMERNVMRATVYVLLFIVAAVCAYFNLLYGATFSAAQNNAWIGAFFTALVMGACAPRALASLPLSLSLSVLWWCGMCVCTCVHA